MSSVTTANTTLGTSLIGIQAIASSSEVVGGEVDVTGKLGANAFIHFGRTTTSAPSSGVSFRFEACPVTTGTLGANAASQWYPLTTYTTSILAASNQTPSGTSGAALTVGAVTGFAAQDVALVSSSSGSPTLSNTEWCRVKSAASATITAEESLKNSYSSGGIWNKAEIAMIPLDLAGVSRLRCVVDGSAHNQGFVCEVYLTTMDSVTST
jgi:hypothetical protein